MNQPDSSLLKISPLEQGLLTQFGVIRDNPEVPQSSELSEGAVQLFVLIASSGEVGQPISRLPKRLKDNWADLALELEIHNLITRERVTSSKVSHLAITWQGEEALERAKSPKPVGDIATRRRASLRP